MTELNSEITPDRPEPAQATSGARGACPRTRCGNPLSARRVVLVGPDGTDRKTCGPYCDPCTDALLRNLTPTYTGGGAAYRIDHEEEPRA